MEIKQVTVPTLVVDVTTQELFEWAEQVMLIATPEQRDLVFFALVSGHRTPIINLFENGIFEKIAPKELLDKLKTVDFSTINIHTGRTIITVQLISITEHHAIAARTS